VGYEENEMIEMPSPPVIICDLDGTLALDHVRAKEFLHHPTNPRNWDAYFAACPNDEPNLPIIALLGAMFNQGYDIWILSGRSMSVFDKTWDWLRKHNVPFDHLIMREIDDRTQDTELKLKWVEERGLKNKIRFIIEDRQRVVDAWRAAGFTVLQCAPGDF
jgi:hypothetical protein